MENIYADIPRLYTAIAEWMACMTYCLVLKRRMKNLEFSVTSVLALIIQSVFLVLTKSLPIYFWIPCMLAAVLLMYLFMYMVCDDTKNVIGYYCARAFLLAELAAAGVTVLRNSFVTLERKGDALLLAGLDDPNGYADMKTPEELAAELQAAGGGFAVLLAHRPNDFPRYAALGFRLVFSGHVHGGMVRLPFLGGVLAPGHVLFPEYDGGLYTLGDSCMVLSRGLAGVSVFPRLFNPLEISVVQLHRG